MFNELTSKTSAPPPPSQPQMLNASYEKAFPGLRYTTFVNGRARADIIPEMEVRPLSSFPHPPFFKKKNAS